MFPDWLDSAPTSYRLTLALVTAALFTSLPAAAAITITPFTLPNGAVGETYSQALSATGGIAPYTWSITSTTTLVFNVTTCPPGGVVFSQGGLTFSSARSICGPVLNGGLTTNSIPSIIDAVVTTPGQAFSASSVDVSAVNNAIPPEVMTITGDLVGGGTVTQTYTYPGNTTTFTTVPLIGFTNITGIHFSIFATDIQNLVITPPSAPPSVPGSLQAGLSLNTSTGAITGTPAGAEAANITFQVRDSTGAAASSQIPLTVNAALASPPATLPDGVQSAPYNHTLTPSGGVGPYTWSIFSGALPPGLNLNSFTGLISGTPTTAGSVTFTLQVADAGARIGNLTTLNIDPPVAVTSSPAPIGDTGLFYSYNNTATGGLGPPYTWSISSGTLPRGLVMDPASGTISGTPLAAGTASLVFKATDSGGNFGLSPAISIVLNPTLSMSTTSLPNGVQSVNYTQSLAATGGTPPYTWTLTGSLPPGFNLAGNGALTGRPTAPGSFAATFTVTDVLGQQVSRQLQITINPPVTITTTTLPTGVQGTLYTQTIAATGGLGSYTFAISAGTPPLGLNLAANGTLSGTPAAAGSSSFTVQVADSSTSQASQAYTLAINGPVTVLTSSLPNARQGTSYTTTLSGSGGIGTLTWSFGATTAGLAGLSIDPRTGVLSGTPNTFGTLAVVVGLRDTQGNSATRTLNLLISQQTPETSDIMVSDHSTTQTVRMSSDGSNPLAVCATGCHVGDIAADAQGNVYARDTSGIYKITPGGSVTTILTRAGGVGGIAVDSSGNVIFVDNQSDSIYRVTPGGALTTVAAFPIPSVDELQDTFVAIDGAGNYIVTSDDSNAVKIYRFSPGGAAVTLATFAAARASGVTVTSSGVIEFVNYQAGTLVGFDPNGVPGNSTVITIPAADTLLYGIAVDPVNGNFIVTGGQTGAVYRVTPAGAVTTLVSNRVFASLEGVAIVPALRPLSITTSSLPGGILGNAYGPAALTASGGSGSYRWTLVGVAPGLLLSTSGLLIGTPAAIGTFTATFTLTDGITGLSTTTSLPVVVAPRIVPISINQTASQVSVAVGGGVSASFGASGGTPPYAFSATGLPGGVSINSSGALSGSASQPGVFNASVSVSDSGGQSARASLIITVLGLNIPGFPVGLVGTPYSASVNGVGGVQPYSFSASGLPAGLSITGTGAISGTPTAAGTSGVTITVSDAGGARLSGTSSITILATGAPVTIASGSLPDATVNLPYAQSLSATGGKAPYTWALVNGSAPDGLTFGANGILSGTPTTPGSYSFGAEVRDSAGGSVSTAATVTVKPAALSITSGSPLASGMNGVEYPAIQLSATGGVNPYKWTLSGGALPAGMTLASGGTISGTPSVGDSFSPGITVTDAAGNKAASSFALTIRPASPDLILSSGSLAFTVTNGADTVPAGQSVTVQSTSVSTQIAYSAQLTPSAPWLTIANGATTPDSIGVTLSPTALTLAAGNYSEVVKVTCGTGSCQGNSQTVNVTLTVAPAPPQLKVDTDVVSFSTTQTALAPLTGSITLENAGGGSLGIASVVCQAVWCRVGGPPGSIAGGSTATVPVTADPSVVSPGFYRTTVDISTSAGKGSVPVILFIAQDSSMTLSSSGGQFSMPVGGAPGNPNGSFLVSVNTTLGVTLTATAAGGPDWLKVNTSGFSASAAQPGTVSFSIDPGAGGKLATGAYYGQISVSGAGLTNSPQFFQVVLNVTPATDTAKPDPQPAGLLFLAAAGGANPPQQTVTVFTSASGATQFQASAASDAGWLVVSPTLGSTSQASPTSTGVAANISGLKAGIYTGTVSYAFAGSGVRSVNVTLVVSPVPGTAVAPLQTLTPRATCAPTTLASVQTGLVSNFSAPTAWPTPLALKVVDNCGAVVTSAQIVTTFTNGDPPLALPLVDPASGLYSGTWTPRKPVANLTINARISAGGFKDLNVQLVGKVTPNAAPILTPHGTVHAFAPLVGAPLAPGDIAAIYGSNLANITGVPNVVPLPTEVNGTQVLIGGIKAPIYFTSDGQVNAQIPYELAPNKQYQVIVVANSALSTPDSIQVSAVVPGLAANADGTVIAQHADGSLINAASPAKGGEVAVAYLSGLGSTSGGDVTSGGASPGGDLATPLVTPTVTVGGVSAKIEFVGLTPGLVGLYQMNFDVPAGLTSGDVDIVVTQSGTSSSRVLLPYTP